MTETASRMIGLAAELRQDFDRSFAIPPSIANTAIEDLLAIRLGARDFAIRLSEIAGLFAAKKITPVPGGDAALLGIAGFRGTILPVYELRQLLGLPGSGTSRWFVLAVAAPVALAFEAFECQLRVSADSIAPQHAHAKQHSCTRDCVHLEKTLRPIIHLPSVLAAIKT